MSSDVFKILNAVNVNEHKSKKGSFDYLSWSDAWEILLKHYPDATHDMLDDVIYSDGTMEVRSSVTVEGRTLKCFLPVIDHRNKAIENPNAFDINKNRMRCLAKNIALFGLGLYIFRGEDLPEPAGISDEEYDHFVGLLANKNGLGLIRYMEELGDDKCSEAFNRAPHGQKVKFKEQVRACQLTGESMIDHYVVELDTTDEVAVLELVAELRGDPWLKGKVWARLSETTKHNIKTILENAQ